MITTGITEKIAACDKQRRSRTGVSSRPFLLAATVQAGLPVGSTGAFTFIPRIETILISRTTTPEERLTRARLGIEIVLFNTRFARANLWIL